MTGGIPRRQSAQPAPANRFAPHRRPRQAAPRKRQAKKPPDNNGKAGLSESPALHFTHAGVFTAAAG